ncbi:MAG: HDOD domain-containing protein [Spirochaetaceae bacterium]|nr:HDOD domain-containing protein [Myxococcales bacterium]MCB9726146.1 HDOD domain-containing protein [Spirochaetaceae bacterium]HPG28805.1 HDOD domain-containing protein [Myxococcota bacterium]
MSRQPIVAGERRLIGWQLVFGSASGETLSSNAERSEPYLEALLEFGGSARWDSLLCGARAVLAVDRRILFSEVLECMPRNRLLLGLAPLDEVDANLSNRLHDLNSRRGTRLLFLDYHRRDKREQLLDLADAVQIDAFGLDAETQGLLVRRAQRRKLQILASSIQRDVDFVRFREAGFDMLHGQSYSDPSKSDETRATADGRVLIQLLVEARGELEIEKVTKQFDAHESLKEGLLRLVNSLELARAQKIESVGQALVMIGAKGLSRWLNLLLFQIGSRHGTRGPLFRVAASRARLMELAVVGSGTEDPAIKQKAETAFLVGILSLVHVLLGVDRKAAITGLTLPPEMTAALSGYEGQLGRLLRLSECLDAGEFPEVVEIAAELGLAPATLWVHQSEAYDWVMRMI